MSNTRAEIITPLFVPLLAGIASTSLVLPMVYLARPIWTITFGICLVMHIHYGCGVVSTKSHLPSFQPFLGARPRYLSEYPSLQNHSNKDGLTNLKFQKKCLRVQKITYNKIAYE